MRLIDVAISAERAAWAHYLATMSADSFRAWYYASKELDRALDSLPVSDMIDRVIELNRKERGSVA